ncbi:MAG: amidophosphoribosyltransferase [Candidatus Bilamarchaeaceae archaeon]
MKREECGVFGIISKDGSDVAPLVYKGLIALQHRGQDAAGLAVSDGKKIEERKGLGLVAEIFKPEDLKVRGHLGIGHTRYPTTCSNNPQDVQPTVKGHVAVAHNGHLANYDAVRAELEKKGHGFDGSVDSEVIAYLLREKDGESDENTVRHVMEKLDGAYSDAAIREGRLIIFRDPHAIRPLVFGENEKYFAFASETPALDINGIPQTGEAGPGEMFIFSLDGGKRMKMERKPVLPLEKRHCMFEYVYFSRPDTVQNGKWVYQVRRELGAQLAREQPAKADIVIPVPDTSRNAAEGFSRESGIPAEEGLIKNRYVGRTFIMPSQEKRRDAVRTKLNAVRGIVSGKKVVLIDDSIVRGTTLKEIIALVRAAGAKEVHIRITSPPIKAPCFYGVDIPTYNELIAHKKSVEEIGKYIGADSLGYLSVDGLKKAIGVPLCTGCLDEGYPTEQGKRNAKKALDEDHRR